MKRPSEPSLHARVVELRGDTAVLEVLRDYGSRQAQRLGGESRATGSKILRSTCSWTPRWTWSPMTGQAGTGKTLLTLAAGLAQVLDSRRYSEIIMTRATVSVGEDIGFLPGTEEEKWALDGRFGRQPGVSGQRQRRQWARVGALSNHDLILQPHQNQELELHAWAHFFK